MPARLVLVLLIIVMVVNIIQLAADRNIQEGGEIVWQQNLLE